MKSLAGQSPRAFRDGRTLLLVAVAAVATASSCARKVVAPPPASAGSYAITASPAPTSSPGGSAVAPPAQAAGYNLIFADDFSDFRLSPNGTGNYNWFNPGIWWESAAPAANISVSNSILTLNWTAGQANADTSVSTSAVDGSHAQAWRYGYIEVSMRWDVTTGAWPAIWMIPTQGIDDETGEIDIFEGQGNTPTTYYGTIHDWKNNIDVANNGGSNVYPLPSGTDLSQFHTYGLLWVPGKVTWYLDNQPLNTASTYAIFDQLNYYLILSSQEGADWTAGNLTGVTANSIEMNVQWVHVFQP